MRIRRSFPILIGVLLVAGAVALVVVLRKHAPPEPARLLPGADGFVYVDFKWARRVSLLVNLPQVEHDPSYEQFIQGTGINAERDLDEAALAIHYPPSPQAGNDDLTRFSEVLVGHFDSERLTSYLKKTATSSEAYHSLDIYSIPLESRTLRVAIISANTVAASNVADPLVIKGIIDRSRKLASPFAGPAFLRQYYKEVPLASLAWTIIKVNPPNDASGAGFQGWSFLFPKPAVVVASARYLGSVHLKAAAFTENSDDAALLAQKLGTFLNVFRTAQSTASSGPDPDVKTLFDSLKVEQSSDRAVVSAVASPAFVHKLLEAPPTELPSLQTQPAEPAPAPPPPPAKAKKHK